MLVFFARAQNLPKKQEISLRAPDNIKIDGKTTEWNDRFQAHNRANRMYYTLSNDDNNLYLTAQMDDIEGSKKIFRGGLTFTIIPISKKANRLSITFPVIKKRPVLEGGGGTLVVYETLKSDT